MKIRDVKAHCDIPCAVYDPGVAQYAALSVVRFLDLIGEMPENIDSKKDLAHLTRLVQQKEEHAIEVKDAVRTIWGDCARRLRAGIVREIVRGMDDVAWRLPSRKTEATQLVPRLQSRESVYMCQASSPSALLRVALG